jgi:hypothetical protein
MHPRTLLVALASLAWAAGCQAPLSQQLLVRENRDLEDRVFELEGILEDNCDLVDELEAEKEALRAQLAERRRESDLDGGRDAPRRPLIDLGTPTEAPPETAPAPSFRSDDEGPTPPSGGGAAAVPDTGASSRVARIVVDRRMRPGAEGTPGGVVLIVEPRDGRGDLVAAPAELSVMVLERPRRGEPKRLARWDFTSGDVASRLRRTSEGDLIYLDLDLPAAPPTDNNVRLYVRYVTADGRKLLADVPLDDHPIAARGRDWRAAANGPRLASDEQPTDESAPEAGSSRAASESSPGRPAWSPYR